MKVSIFFYLRQFTELIRTTADHFIVGLGLVYKQDVKLLHDVMGIWQVKNMDFSLLKKYILKTLKIRQLSTPAQNLVTVVLPV